MSVVAVLHIVPVHPDNRIELNTKVPLAPNRCGVRTLKAVHHSGFLVLPHFEQHRHLFAAELVKMLVSAFLFACRDVLQVALTHAIALCVFFRLFHRHAPLNDEIRLLLHIAPVRIPEDDLRVLQHLRSDLPSAFLSGLSVRVPIGIHTPVSIHRSVSAELADTASHFVSLKNCGKLVV